MHPDVAGITHDIILIGLTTYKTVQTCTQWHMVQWQKKCVNGNDPKKISNNCDLANTMILSSVAK